MGEIGKARLNDPFLIDECLSHDLVALAAARHHYATHVVFRGLQGKLDRVPVIQEGNFVLVTNNGKDFLALYAELELHPGLVIIIPGSIGREKQLDFFGRVLDVIESRTGIINKVVEVFSDGRIELRDWPERGTKPNNAPDG